MRNTISLGGDVDTLAAIAGPIGEAMPEIPSTIRQQAENFYLVDTPILAVIRKIYGIIDRGDRKMISHPVGASMECPNCDPRWKLMGICHRFVHRYGYEHVTNDFAPSPKVMKFRIVEPDPDRMGWIRLVEIDGTQTTFREMRYNRESLDVYWKYHCLNCGCEIERNPKKSTRGSGKIVMDVEDTKQNGCLFVMPSDSSYALCYTGAL